MTTQEQKNLIKELYKKKLENIDVDLALVDADGLILEDHIKKGQIESYEEQVLDKILNCLELDYDMWYKDETDYDENFLENRFNFYGVLDILWWISDIYVTSKYSGYKKNIYVYDYSGACDKDCIGIWFGSGQFFDVCELGMMQYANKAWRNRHD